MWYKLGEDGKSVVPIDGDFPQEGEVTNATVAKSKLENGFTISTVFMGLDYGSRTGILQVFETMVFGKSWLDLDCERYSTWEQAEEGHKRMCDKWKRMCLEDFDED